MTVDVDPFASYRPLLVAELGKAAAISQGHAQVLRDQVSMVMTTAGDASFLPSFLCLVTVEAMGGVIQDALPSATALALLHVMAQTFAGLAGDSRDGLASKWGMARSLNAGDAFFALAQRTFLTAQGSDAEHRLGCVDVLDEACHRFGEMIFTRFDSRAAGEPSDPLLESAAALGGLLAGSDDRRVGQLRLLGGALADGSSYEEHILTLPEEARPRLSAAADYIARKRAR